MLLCHKDRVMGFVIAIISWQPKSGVIGSGEVVLVFDKHMGSLEAWRWNWALDQKDEGSETT